MCYVFVCLTVLCVVIVHVLCVYYQSVLCVFFSLCYVRALVCAMFSLQSRTSSLRSEHASLRSRGSLRSLRALRARRTRFETPMLWLPLLELDFWTSLIYTYGNVPLISDKANMIKCILRVFRSNTIDIIYYTSMYMMKWLLDGSFHVFVCVFIAAAGAFFRLNIVKNNDNSSIYGFYFIL